MASEGRGTSIEDEACEAVIGRFVFGAQTCMRQAVARVQCPDPECRDEPHTHAVCGIHVWRGSTEVDV